MNREKYRSFNGLVLKRAVDSVKWNSLPFQLE